MWDEKLVVDEDMCFIYFYQTLKQKVVSMLVLQSNNYLVYLILVI